MILEVKQWPESQEIMDDPEWFFIVDGGKELTLGDSAYARIIGEDYTEVEGYGKVIKGTTNYVHPFTWSRKDIKAGKSKPTDSTFNRLAKLEIDEKGEIISRTVEDKKAPIDKTHKGNNKRILKYIDSRMDEGIKKFRQEMPLEFYTVNDILEEVVDACIYASSLLIKIDGAYKRILKEENK